MEEFIMKRDLKKIISQMTLEEKAGMCSGLDFWHLKSVERLGIPEVMVSDGPHGLRKQDDKGDHLGMNDSIKAGILYLRDVRIYRNMNLMQVSVGSMMLSGMVRQTEYSPFFRSHRMELLEYCTEMNCETVRICLSQELRCLPELLLKVVYLKKLLMH